MGAVGRAVYSRTGAAAFGRHEAHRAPDGPAAMANSGTFCADGRSPAGVADAAIRPPAPPRLEPSAATSGLARSATMDAPAPRRTSCDAPPRPGAVTEQAG